METYGPFATVSFSPILLSLQLQVASDYHMETRCKDDEVNHTLFSKISSSVCDNVGRSFPSRGYLLNVGIKFCIRGTCISQLPDRIKDASCVMVF